MRHSRTSASHASADVERVRELDEAVSRCRLTDRPLLMLDREKSARYRQIVAVFQARITSGLYPLGSLLPTEAELCAEFDVSRYTVRETLRRLMALGLISRRQGSGTMVVRTEVGG